MTTPNQDYWQEDIHVNRAQYAYLMLQAKNKYAIMSRGTGKSFIVGAEVDENVRIMPRGITTIAQATIGQALTKTLPSTFKMLEMLGYKPYDYETHTGDYVVCKRPPESFIRPYEHIMQFDMSFRSATVTVCMSSRRRAAAAVLTPTSTSPTRR